MTTLTLPRHLHRTLRLNAGLVQAQTNGLSHADSLLQPAEGGNRLNWHLGHLVQNRVAMFSATGLSLPFDRAPYSRYERDSPPLQEDDATLPLPTLLADFAAALEPLLAWLSDTPEEEMDKPAPGETRSILERMAFLVWHESIHVGQLEQYRRLAGQLEKVV